MPSTLILILASLVVSLALLGYHTRSKSNYLTFKEYKIIYNLHFRNGFEEKFREVIYNENVAAIEYHNSQKNQTYTMGINQFTYLTKIEFVDIYLRFVSTSSPLQVDETDTAANELDWSSYGAVTSVKNQGNCGSCWAFSSTGALEGLGKINSGTLQEFSEQQLIDCSSAYGNTGCNGGSMESAFSYVRAHGITTESAYPYKAVKGTCQTSLGSFKISTYTTTPGCTALTNALLHGPVSVAVDSSNWSPYQSGVLSNCSGNLNHGVLLTGISNDYWRIKNSWGSSWGEKGFIRISRGNTCGVCAQPSIPIK